LAFRGRGPRFIPPPQDAHRINRNIRCPQVRLIGPDGQQIGVVSTEEALRHAERAHLDLVEVAPTAQPPVCRILDYGKFKYQEHKKEVEARKKQSTTTVKELRLGYRTGSHDIARQVEKAREFLNAGDRVKFTLRFRGREMEYQDLGRKKLLGVCEALQDVGQVEGNPRMEGRLMGVVLAPGAKKKPVVKAAKPAPPRSSDAAAASDESAAPEPGLVERLRHSGSHDNRTTARHPDPSAS
jgi:translation initiation factor IF-3